MQSCLYEGRVEHARVSPVAHAFGYRLFMLYLDLDELPRVFAGRWLWSARRPAVAWFRRADYLGDPREPLADSVRALVAEATGRRPAGPVRLLTHLRYFGYCFNPVSFYYCFDASGTRVETIVAEVHNTPWNERHCYVLDANGNAARRFTTEKALHVSPFMPMEMAYDWVLSDPADRLGVTMRCSRGGERLFTAVLNLRRREIGAASLAAALVRYPFMTLKVIAAIYWQALLLKWRGCPTYVHPSKRASARSS
jgi:DUF1365 family protein